MNIKPEDRKNPGVDIQEFFHKLRKWVNQADILMFHSPNAQFSGNTYGHPYPTGFIEDVLKQDKLVLVEYHGSDIRGNEQGFHAASLIQNKFPEVVLMGSTPDLLAHLGRDSIWLPQCPPEIPESVVAVQNEEFTVIHPCSTNPAIKGTPVVVEAMSKLSIPWDLITMVPWPHALQRMARGHYLLDQFVINGGYGTTCLEATILGLQVGTSMDLNLKKSMTTLGEKLGLGSKIPFDVVAGDPDKMMEAVAYAKKRHSDGTSGAMTAFAREWVHKVHFEYPPDLIKAVYDNHQDQRK